VKEHGIDHQASRGPPRRLQALLGLVVIATPCHCLLPSRSLSRCCCSMFACPRVIAAKGERTPRTPTQWWLRGISSTQRSDHHQITDHAESGLILVAVGLGKAGWD